MMYQIKDWDNWNYFGKPLNTAMSKISEDDHWNLMNEMSDLITF